jgi:DUF4097 and DUF4098 domain-containing protein YvlB
MKKYLMLCAGMLAAGLLIAGCGKIEGYHYDNSDTYTAGSFSYDEDSIDSVEINWISGNVYIDESVMSPLEIREESEKELSDEDKLRYKIEDRKLVIQFCESGVDTGGKKKDLYVKLPILLDNVELNLVSANTEMVSSAADIDINAVSGESYVYVDQCERLDINSVSGDAHVVLDSSLGSKVEFETVSGKYTGDEKSLDKMCNIKCNTVSGDLEVSAE